MKNLKKISRKDLKKVKGGGPFIIPGTGVVPIGGGNPVVGCYQHMEQFLLDCNTDPENELCKPCP